MNKVLKTVIMSVILLGLLISFSACTTDSDFKEVQKINTIRAYSDYIVSHPTGRHTIEAYKLAEAICKADFTNQDVLNDFIICFPDTTFAEEVKTQYEYLEWLKTRESGSIKRAEAFLKKYPDTVYKIDAEEMMEDIYFNSAVSEYSVESYKVYLSRYPEGAYIDLAKRQIEILLVESVINSKNLEDYRAYFSDDHPAEYIKIVTEAYGKELLSRIKGTLCSVEICEEYLSKFPNSSEVDFVKMQKFEAEWRDAKNYTTIREYLEYIEAHPGGKYNGLANDKINELIDSDQPYQNFITAPITEESIAKFLEDFPDHKDTNLVKRSLGYIDDGELTSLIELGHISAEIVGYTVSYTSFKITNNENYPINFTIACGTWLKSRNSQISDMLVTTTTTIFLDGNESYETMLSTACMNIEKEFPSDGDKFTAHLYEKSNPLTKLVKAAVENESDFPEIQAAVWIIISDVNEERLVTSIIYPDGSSAITKEDVAKAQSLVLQAMRTDN